MLNDSGMAFIGPSLPFLMSYAATLSLKEDSKLGLARSGPDPKRVTTCVDSNYVTTSSKFPIIFSGIFEQENLHNLTPHVSS